MGQSKATKPEAPPAASAIQIDALGGLRVSVGDRLLGLPNQPFRCALLLYLVVENPTTRKAITDVLWPDRDPARARRSLSQTLYELKRDLQTPLLETAGEVIEVTDTVDLDVAHFLQAVEDEDDDTAIALYHGPFLGDVHLSTTVPFERWAEELRLRLERAYGKICHRRLAELERDERWSELADLARDWTEREKLKDEAWHYLILGLWKTGRSREALASYEWFRAALEHDVEMAPVEQTEELVREIRAELEGQPRVAPTIATEEAPAPEPAAAVAPHPPTARRTWPWWAAALAAAGVAGALLARPGPDAFGPVPEEARVIAVAPMDAIGDVPEELPSGIPSLVASVLDQVEGLRTVPPTRFASVAAARGLSFQTEDVAQVGRALNAHSVLTGTLSAVEGGLRGEVILRSASNGGTMAYASATAHADSASVLVDSLAIGLLRDLWRADEPVPNMRISAITSSDPQALRHFIRGERHMLLSQWDSAQTEYGLATLADPDFALAHVRGGDAAAWGRTFGLSPNRELLEVAYEHRDRLPRREQALVRVNWLDLAGRLEALDSAAAFLERYPDDVDGWYELGDVRTHAWKLVPNTPLTLLEPFDRAIALEPRLSSAYIHPLQIAASIGDRSLFQAYLNGFARHSAGADRVFDGWIDAIWGNDGEAAGGWERALASEGRTSIVPLVQGYLEHGRHPVETLLRALESAEVSFPERTDRIRRLRVSVLTATGRIEEASAVLAPLFDADPFQTSVAAAHIVAATALSPPAVQMAKRYFRASPDDPLSCVWLIWILLAEGEVDDAAVELSRVRSTLGTDTSEQMRGLLDGTAGWIDVLRGEREAGVRRMEAGLLQAGYGHASGPLLRAWERTLAQSPELEETALERYRFSRSDLEFLVPRMLEYAGILRTRGEDAEAGIIERRIRRLWGAADVELFQSVRTAGRRP